MEIAFFRHGQALSIQEAGVDSDFERPLSQNGEKQVIESANNLKNNNFIPQIILSSSFKRAERTSKIIADIFNIKEINFLKELSIMNDPNIIIDVIKKNCFIKNAIIVGHQPMLGLLARIITGEENIELKPAGYALIEINDVKIFNGRLKLNFNIAD